MTLQYTTVVQQYSSTKLPACTINYLALFRLFCAAGSQLGEHENTSVCRFWLPTTHVWRARRPHTLHQERASISRTVGACEELYVAVRK